MTVPLKECSIEESSGLGKFKKIGIGIAVVIGIFVVIGVAISVSKNGANIEEDSSQVSKEQPVSTTSSISKDNVSPKPLQEQQPQQQVFDEKSAKIVVLSAVKSTSSEPSAGMYGEVQNNLPYPIKLNGAEIGYLRTGEKSPFYSSGTNADDINLVWHPVKIVKPAKLELHDIKTSTTDLGTFVIEGKVTNHGDEDAHWATVTYVIYDKNSQPIPLKLTSANSWVERSYQDLDGISPDETVPFQIKIRDLPDAKYASLNVQSDEYAMMNNQLPNVSDSESQRAGVNYNSVYYILHVHYNEKQYNLIGGGEDGTLIPRIEVIDPSQSLIILSAEGGRNGTLTLPKDLIDGISRVRGMITINGSSGAIEIPFQVVSSDTFSTTIKFSGNTGRLQVFGEKVAQ